MSDKQEPNILRNTFNIFKENNEQRRAGISQFNYTNNDDDENIDIYMSESSDNMSESSESDTKKILNVYELNDMDFDFDVDISSTSGKKEYKRYNYKEVEVKIDKYYFEKNHKYSSALDILASYLNLFYIN